MSEPALSPILTTSMGFLLNKAGQKLKQDLEMELNKLGIQSREFGVLATLMHNGPISQQMVVKIIKIDRTTMVSLIDALEKHKFVERRPDPADRRAYLLEITDLGRDIFKQATEIIQQSEDKCLNLLSDRMRNNLRDYLLKIITD